MAEKHSVGFETREGPDFKPCGGFIWEIRFLITDAAGAKLIPKQRRADSWVVQHVVFKEKIMTCSGTDLDADDHDYWEAFRIGADGWATDEYRFDFGGTAGEQYIEAGREDRVVEPDSPKTCGGRSVDLKAYWLEILPAGSMERSSVVHIKEANGLPASLNPPPGLDPGDWTLHRRVELAWNCCSKRAECPTEPGTSTGNATARNSAGTYEENWTSEKKHRKIVAGVEVP